MIPQSMQPPPLAVIAHGKLPFHVMFQFQSAMPGIQNRPVVTPRTSARLFNPPACFALMRFSVGWCVSLLFEASETLMSRLRNFDTKPPSSYCYEFRSDNRLESVANVHTAADLHARPVP
jgi:hypothetical protein